MSIKEWTKEERYRELKDPSELKDLYERIQKSIYRQKYHIQPITGLLNDPNGFVYHDGCWHLFYQWCPWGAVHGLKHWYHTTSKDLVNWTNAGLCIKPDTEYDNKGAYSGSAFLGEDSICLFYTGNHRDPDWKRVPYTCVVKMFDDGRIEKLERPIFGPTDKMSDDQRDPKILYNEELKKYFIVIGARTHDKKGCCIIYESDNLLEGWKYAGQLKVPGFEDFGGMWECPSIERINGNDILIFCPQYLKLERRGNVTNHNGYIIGNMDWETLTFMPEGHFHVLDFGFDSYAAECAANLEGEERAVLVAWMGLPDSSYPTDEDEWSGCLTLPRELRVRNRRLIQTPLPQLAELREVEVDAEDILSGREKLAGPMEMLFETGDGDFELKLFTDEQGNGGLSLKYNDEERMFTVDRSGLSQRFNIEQGEVRMHEIDSPLRTLRIYLDTSSVEIFVNDGDAVFTSRVFPTDREVSFKVTEGAGIKIWRLKSVSNTDFVVTQKKH